MNTEQAKTAATPPAGAGMVLVPNGVESVEQDFDWDGVKQHHVPKLILRFQPVPANHPIDSKGWADRDSFAKQLQPAPAPAQPELFGGDVAPPWMLTGDSALRISYEHRVTAGAVQDIAKALYSTIRAAAQPQLSEAEIDAARYRHWRDHAEILCVELRYESPAWIDAYLSAAMQGSK